MILALLAMVYVVYNYTPNVHVTPSPHTSVHDNTVAVGAPKADRRCTSSRALSAAPQTVAIRSSSTVTMPPAPARKPSGEKTALFAGNWFKDDCPYELEFDAGSFRGDPYSKRGQKATSDWAACATELSYELL